MKFYYLTACGALLLSSGFCFAERINVATGNGSTTPHGAGYIGSVTDDWNAIDCSGGSIGPTSLTDATGAATGVTATVTCEGAVPALNSSSQPFADLTHYYAFNNTGGTIFVSFTGLSANTVYTLIAYVASDDATGGDRSLTGSASSVSDFKTFSATGDPQSTFMLGENIIDVNVMTDAVGNLLFQESDGATNTSGEVDLSGIQLQAVPEPSALIGLGLAAVGLLRKRVRAH